MECKDVILQHIEKAFPPADVVQKWFEGIDTEDEWPPQPEPLELRFPAGTFVLCRVGPAEWAPGRVVQQWYREANWEPGMYAPYKIHLEDGRFIFAPQDMDQIIRLDPNKEHQPLTTTDAAETTVEDSE